MWLANLARPCWLIEVTLHLDIGFKTKREIVTLLQYTAIFPVPFYQSFYVWQEGSNRGKGEG
ncbi:MAG TPA: hypothetical protein ENK96_03310 [Desulfobulbaceae bacterium]|nr:hypothetical protein [Desulfobulbaceae bacterium]